MEGTPESTADDAPQITIASPRQRRPRCYLGVSRQRVAAIRPYPEGRAEAAELRGFLSNESLPKQT